MMYLVSVMSDEGPQWFEVDAGSADEAIRTVIDRVLDGGPLGAGVEVSAVPKPTAAMHIERLADMSEFEAEFRET